MTSNQSQELNDEAQMRVLIERWARAMTKEPAEKPTSLKGTAFRPSVSACNYVRL